MTKTRIEADCEIPFRESSPPIWRELGWWLEWANLRRSSVYHGIGLQPGDGSTIILVPGFLASDAYLSELQNWLIRIGYRVAPSGLDRNMDCPDVSLSRLLEAAESASEVAGQRVRLIGHSLGGTLSRAAAVRRPDLIEQVITLGSPIREVAAHPLVMTIARFLESYLPSPDESPRHHGDHFHDGDCSCETLAALSAAFPEDVARTAVYTRLDGVIDWRTALDSDPAANLEVHGTHLGLVVNREVYHALARLLSAGGDQKMELNAA
jgi:pimeloyl-ACP methyl ester carboxylesterase